MDLNLTIPEIETRLREAGITVDEFCEKCEIDRATWQRWKRTDDGRTTPRLDVWRRVVANVPQAKGEAA
jgi:hypothetical protein